ncbi:hypothetical protein EX30DRAFT_364508 [Ascodesmis nigricans]|uniref:Uncharacterized protein n=1 Tax=Ascodesmis nigricans TaxID=341454 RepID=A0A4S2MVF5_9PEZI|nr:hypothetical protein EX30DRAFT_364508 [Ascodesmis nigricans]
MVARCPVKKSFYQKIPATLSSPPYFQNDYYDADDSDIDDSNFDDSDFDDLDLFEANHPNTDYSNTHDSNTDDMEIKPDFTSLYDSDTNDTEDMEIEPDFTTSHDSKQWCLAEAIERLRVEGPETLWREWEAANIVLEQRHTWMSQR